MLPTCITVAILAALVVTATAQQCSYDVRENHIIDVKAAEKLGAVFMSDVNSLTEEDCQSACCELEEAILDDGSTAKCNLAIFHDRNDESSSNKKNCFLVFCPSEESCMLLKVNKFSSSFVTHVPESETTEPEEFNGLMEDYDVPDLKPAKPQFDHPDAPPISFHKLFRRSPSHRKGALKAQAMKQPQNVLKAVEKLLHPKLGPKVQIKTDNKIIQEEKRMDAIIKNILRVKKGFKSTTEGPTSTDRPTAQTKSAGSLVTTTSKIVTGEKTTQKSGTQKATTLQAPTSVSETTISTGAILATTLSKSTTSGQTTPTAKSQSSFRGTTTQETTSNISTQNPTPSLTHSKGHGTTSLLTKLPATTSTNLATPLSPVQSTPSGKVTPALLPNGTLVETPKPDIVSKHGKAFLPNPMTLPHSPGYLNPGPLTLSPQSPKSTGFPVGTPLQSNSPNTTNITSTVSFTSLPPDSLKTSPQDRPTQSSSQSQTMPPLTSNDPSHNASVTSSQTLYLTLHANMSTDAPSHNASSPPTMHANSSSNASSSNASKSHPHPLSTRTPMPKTVPFSIAAVTPPSHNITDPSLLTDQATETTESSSPLVQEDLMSSPSSTPAPEPDVSTNLMSQASSSKPTPIAPSSNSTVGLVQLPTLGEIRRNDNLTKVHNDTAASVDDSKDGQNEKKKSVIASNGALIAAVCFGVIFLLAVVVILSKHWYEAYQRRHYSKVDYLINGMYN